MSLLELALSRKEVLYSLAAVAVVLFSALALMIAPALYRGWKRIMKRRKTQRAARLARQKRAKQHAGQARRQRAAHASGERPARDPNAAPSAPAIAEAASEEGAPQPVPESEAETEPKPEAEAEPVTMTEVASDVQDILNSVFVDEEANARYEVLLRGIEVVSAEQLVVLANSVAARLQSGEPNPA